MQPHLSNLERHLKLRGYTLSTLEHYLENFTYFLKYFKGRLPSSITVIDIENYQLYLRYTKKQSARYVNQQIATVKFYFENVFMAKLDYEKIVYLKEPKNLPVVISYDEIRRLLTTAMPIKYQFIFNLMYSCGIRPGELVKLKMGDISPSESVIFIREGKGQKQRYVPLSPIVNDLFKKYQISHFKNREDREQWLFPSFDTNQTMGVDTIASVYRRLKKN